MSPEMIPTTFTEENPYREKDPLERPTIHIGKVPVVKEFKPLELPEPIPFDIDSYFMEWNKTQPIDDIGNNHDSFSNVLDSISRPFVAQGYNSIAALNRGAASFYSHLDAIADFIEMSGFGSKGGIFEKFAKVSEEKADYWKDRANKVGINFFDELVSEAVGNAVPAILQFTMDVASGFTFPYMSGASGAEKRGDQPFVAGIIEAGKTATLSSLFRMMGPLQQYLKSPTIGTIFGLQEMSEAPEGQKSKAFAKGFFTGAGYSLTSPGGRLGLNEIANNLKPEIARFVELNKRLGERGSTSKPPEKPLSPEGEILLYHGRKENPKYPHSGWYTTQIKEAESYAKTAQGEGKPVVDVIRASDLPPDVFKLANEEYPISPSEYFKYNDRVGFGDNFKQPIPKETLQLLGETKPRKFLNTVEAAEETLPELKERINKLPDDAKDYYVQPNKESLEKADNRIATEGIDKTVDYALSKEPLSAEKGATFIRLMEKFQQEGDFDRAIQMVEGYDMQLREAGRFVQAASIWNRLTPGGFIRWAEKQLEATRVKYGPADVLFRNKPDSFKLTPEEKKSIFEKMTEINKMPDGLEKTNATLQVIDMVAQKVPPSVSEMFDAYRYQNMLSGPRTHFRNISENLFNTFMTKPVDLTLRGGLDFVESSLFGKERQAYISDVPAYYKASINAVPNAINAFTSVMKGEVELYKPELGLDVGSVFKAARSKQIPKGLTVVQRFMEACDKFNTTLIGAGEFVVQKKRGATDAEAYQKAQQAGEKYLYRDKLEPNDPNISYPSKALASLGKAVEHTRTLPGLKTISKWYVPFIKTPINKAIQMVEHSPLGIIRSDLKDQEAYAKIMAGGLAMGAGTLFAMQGETTWAPPSNPQEKELFYASGRKPFSVRMGDKWIPVWYFGPYALSFAIPMAAKYYGQDERKAMVSGGAEKLFDIAQGTAQFLGNQTSTQSIGALFGALSGDIDYKLASATAFTIQQVIPGQGLIRFVNTIMDPVYRKPQSFVERIEKDLPFMSNHLNARMDSYFNEIRREQQNYFLPYDVGTVDKGNELEYQIQKPKLQESYLVNKFLELGNKYNRGEITFENALEQQMDLINKSVEIYGRGKP